MDNSHNRPCVPTLRAVIAASPIVLAASPRDFAEWCRRQPADIDTVILEWLRSQQPRTSARA